MHSVLCVFGNFCICFIQFTFIIHSYWGWGLAVWPLRMKENFPDSYAPFGLPEPLSFLLLLIIIVITYYNYTCTYLYLLLVLAGGSSTCPAGLPELASFPTVFRLALRTERTLVVIATLVSFMLFHFLSFFIMLFHL